MQDGPEVVVVRVVVAGEVLKYLLVKDCGCEMRRAGLGERRRRWGRVTVNIAACTLLGGKIEAAIVRVNISLCVCKRERDRRREGSGDGG